MDKLVIFDTTLRDGEQAAGGTMLAEEKRQIAKQLEKLGVDVIEAGFPASSRGELETVKVIAKEIKSATVCGLARAKKEDIASCWEAVKYARNPRIHFFIPTSDIQITRQLKKTSGEILEMAVAMVKYAKSLCPDVEFSAMDATRTPTNFLYKILSETIKAGAATVNVPDTVGEMTPDEMSEFIDGIVNCVPNISRAVLSVHCHNDLGLATANTLAAIQYGARQAECTINGIGERAGNAALEEIVMAVKTKPGRFSQSRVINIDTSQIYKTSKLVSEMTGFPVPANKAIVGQNAFRHASGVHQHGVLQDPLTFQILDPKTVGMPAIQLPVGKLSGRHALEERLLELGYALNEKEFQTFYDSFKKLADKKKDIADKDLESLITEEQRKKTGIFQLDRIQITCGNKGIPMAGVKILGPDEKIFESVEIGTGPVDAAYKAINKALGVSNKLTEFTIKSITEGIDAIGEVLIRIESNGKTYTGRGTDTDIVVASAKAYLNSLNRLLATKN